MPTLVRGLCNTDRTIKTPNGFTLLELLVVLVVLSIATALLVVRGMPSDKSHLHAEASKLAQLLRIAQQEALLKSKDIRFWITPTGYQFDEFTGNRWAQVQSEPMLRPRLWEHGPLDVVLLQEGKASPFLLLEHTQGMQQQTIVFTKNQTRLVLNRDNGKHFQVMTTK